MNAINSLTYNIAKSGALIAEIAAMCGDDDQALIDTLDGETDVIAAAQRVLKWLHEQEANERACKELAATYRDRAKAFDERVGRARASLAHVMSELGIKTLPLAEGTLTMSAGRVSVAGNADPESLPDDLVKIERTPDRTAIRKALESGVTVPGFALSNSPPTLTIRMK